MRRHVPANPNNDHSLDGLFKSSLDLVVAEFFLLHGLGCREVPADAMNVCFQLLYNGEWPML